MRIIGAGTRDGTAYRELRTFWTIPNLVTVLRFGLVPLFVWLVAEHAYAWATGVLVVLGLSDWIDGYLARLLNQVSSVGKWLDPVADRLALVVVATTFVVAGIAPAWLVYAIVVPDVILIINALVLFRGNPRLPVSVVGKVRTALLLVGTPLLLLSRVDIRHGPILAGVATIVLAIGCVLHVVAACFYFVNAHRKARAIASGEPWSG